MGRSQRARPGQPAARRKPARLTGEEVMRELDKLAPLCPPMDAEAFLDDGELESTRTLPPSGHCSILGTSSIGPCTGFFHPLANEEWLISGWPEFETLDGLRQLCLDSAGPPAATIEAIRRLFKLRRARGPFREVEASLDAAGRAVRQMSANPATTLGCAADALRVARLLP